MSHSNDNVVSRERIAREQAYPETDAAGGLRRRPGFSEPPQSFYPHAAREFVASDNVYEGGISAQPPPPE